MATELLEIQPRELRFIFELKKQSSSSIILNNRTENFVAFKVKTTQPKKYCVRPNIGVIKPKSSCDFTVTMQAQKVAPPDMKCKDKFLVQSTIVPYGTNEEELTSDTFSKESGKYLEERKVRVLLVSPVESAVLQSIPEGPKQDLVAETSVPSDRVTSGIENIPPPCMVCEHTQRPDAGNDSVGPQAQTSEIGTMPYWDEEELKTYQDIQYPNTAEELESLKSKLRVMYSKLREADITIGKLNDERRAINREKEKLKRNLELLRASRPKKIQIGFPLMYVCMVALISMFMGYSVQL